MDQPSPREQAGMLLNRALEQARQGAHADALAALPEALALAPEDVTVQHRAGVILKVCGDAAKAAGCFERALSLDPSFHYAALELGALAHVAGDLDAARDWYDRAIAASPKALTAYIAAAKLEHQRGRGWPALALLGAAEKIDPDNMEVQLLAAEVETGHGHFPGSAARLERVFAAGLGDGALHRRFMHQLTVMGAYPKLLAHRASVSFPAGSADAFHADLFSGQAKLAIAYDRAALLATARAREASARFADAVAVQTRLKAAIAARQPYSLIRLGDGEGRFLAFLDPAMGSLMRPEEHQAIGQSIWSNWFAADLAETGPAQLTALRAALRASLEGADIIGLPLESRLTVDNYHLGYLAYLDRYVSGILDRQPQIMVADAFVNNELHRLSPFCADLLRGLDFIGVIGPHPALAGRLAAHLGIPAHATQLIPGEMRLPDRPELTRGRGHFPERYAAILREMTLPRPGAVVLVAAGLLGKIYCARVKELGGIAIDIGSVVDAWMGFNTRPGQYDKAQAWMLP